MTDPLAGLDIPGCAFELSRHGEATVFTVILDPPPRDGKGLHLVACDAGGLRIALAADMGDGTRDEAVRRALHPDASPDRDDVYVMACRFGLVPSGRDRGGVETGDLAIWLAERVEAAHPEAKARERIETVAACQRRMLAAGLSEILDGIGPDRMAMQTRARQVLVHGDTRRLSMPAAKARALVDAGDAYRALSAGLATYDRVIDATGTPHEVALDFLRKLNFSPTQGRAILRRFLDDGGPDEFLDRLVEVMRAIPVDWLPEGPDSGNWNALSRLSSCLSAAHARTHQPVDALAAAAKGRWAAYAHHLAQAAGVGLDEVPTFADTEYRSLRQAADDIVDFETDILDTLARPLLSWQEGEEAAGEDAIDLARDLLFRDRGLARILAMSARWHRAGGVPLPAPSGHARSQSWEPVLPRQNIDGLLIVPLADRGALADEGMKGADAQGREGLSHCVGGYWQACVQGKTRIMGVRRARDGARVSTFEVAFSDRGISLVQHRGRGNAEPGQREAQVVNLYMAALLQGSLPHDPSPCTEARRRKGAVPLHEACGYDWRDEDALARAIDAWAPYLVRPLRGLSPGAFLEAVGRAQPDAPGPRP